MVGQEEEIIYFILLILRYKQVFVFHKRYKLFCCNREDRTRQRGKQKKKNGKKKYSKTKDRILMMLLSLYLILIDMT